MANLANAAGTHRLRPDALLSPEGWAYTADATTIDGVTALDGWLFLRGRDIVWATETGERQVPPEDDDPLHPLDYEQHALDYLDPDGEHDALPEMLAALCSIRPPYEVLRLGDHYGNPDLATLFGAMRQYLYLTDTDYILAVLAAAAIQFHDSDPLWMMVVSPSSSGKGEALKLIRTVTDAVLNDVTVAGLLGKGGTGVLTRIPADALLVITDFSSMLDDPHMSGATKGQVFSALRDIYDGAYQRDINPLPLSWRGRVSMVAACTPSIDQYSSHADALGTRWLYYRVPERDQNTRTEMAALVTTRKDLDARRNLATGLATDIIQAARARVRSGADLPEAVTSAIISLGVLAGYGRATVPRDYQRRIDGVVQTEEPGRLVNQLRSLALGLVALGLADNDVLRITRRAALSSMPQARAMVLQHVRADATSTTYGVAKAAGLHIHVAHRALEDWAATGVLLNGSRDTEQPAEVWWVAPEFASLVSTGQETE